MKWIRWQGLITFVVLLLFVIVAWFLFVDVAVKKIIESKGTKLVKAKVELADADLSIFPLGLFLTGLEVANPDAPMTNAFQVDRVALSLEGAKLLRRKVIFKEMTLEGVKLNTPRKTSGAISEKRSRIPVVSKESSEEKMKWPSFKIPDVKEILQKEKLQSLELIASFRGDLQTEKEKWQSRLAQLPDKNKLGEYQKKINRLKSGKQRGLEGILGGAREVLTLQKELSRDLDLIKTAQKELGQNMTSLRKRMAEVKKAPQEDLRRLKEKYSPSPEGLANASRLFFGKKVGNWTETFLNWYKKLGPILERVKERKHGREVVKPTRGKGVDVRFKEQEAYPDFLIQIAHVAIEIPAGLVKGQVRNITPDQDILGAPLMYEVAGVNLTGIASLKIDGSLNHVDPFSAKDTANILIRGYDVSDMDLSSDAELPIVLKRATADLEARVTIAGETLKANSLIVLKSVNMGTPNEEDTNSLMKALFSVISDIKAFDLKSEISGTIQDYDLKLSSNLDNVLKDAVKKQVKAQAVQFEKRLLLVIQEKVGGSMADLETTIGGLGSIGSELMARSHFGDELFKRSRKSGSGAMKLPL
ncbi:MAG: TIGR03545 family protein [Deltaproteobacteria bacterium]|nr:TIGR03545 family protein [Deltaproteobacteria bacterium]